MEQTALLVIDMQNHFESMISADMMNNIAFLVGYFRGEQTRRMLHGPGLVVFTQHGHTSEELDVPSAEKSPNQLVRKWGIDGSIREGTKDWEFMEEIEYLVGDLEGAYYQGKTRPSPGRENNPDLTAIVPKNTYDAFINTNLEEVLRSHGIKRVLVCGVMTDCCCDTTARAAFNRGFETWLVKDACASANKIQHERGLAAFGYAFGEVISMREALADLDSLEEDPSDSW